MLRALLVCCAMVLVLVSAGLMMWQASFADDGPTSQWVARPKAPDHEGVPQDLTDKAPLVARAIAGVQDWLRPEDPEPHKPRVNRGGFTNRDGFDIRYSKRPSD